MEPESDVEGILDLPDSEDEDPGTDEEGSMADVKDSEGGEDSDDEVDQVLLDFSSGSSEEYSPGDDERSSDEDDIPVSLHRRRRRRVEQVDRPTPRSSPPPGPSSTPGPSSAPVSPPPSGSPPPPGSPPPSGSPPPPGSPQPPPHPQRPVWMRVYPPERQRRVKSKFRVRDPGPRNTEGCSTPIQFFNLFTTNFVWNLMVRKTNEFAQRHIGTLRAAGRLRPNSRLHYWVNVSVEEIKKFLSLLICMGLTKRKTIELYWSTHPLLYIPFFSRTMSLRRFQQIFSMFHVSNRVSPPRGQPGYDPWVKVRDFIDHMNNSF